METSKGGYDYAGKAPAGSYNKSMDNTLSNAKINLWNVIKIAGVFVSWCIGSGFVTGQESLQYFAGYGIWGYGAILMAMALHTFLCWSFFSLGFTGKYKNPLEIFEFYCGNKILSKIFQFFSVALMASAPIVMISGFGAAVEQHFGIASGVGNVILGIMCLVTIILGLNKLVDICGAIGPIIAVVAIGTALYYLATHFGGLSHGLEIAPSLPLSKIAPVWWMSAYYYVSPLHSAPYLANAATTCNTKKEAIMGGFLGVLIYAVVVSLMVTAIFTNIEELSTKMIPNLFIANSISSVLGFVFVLLIFLGIYSSTVPCLFTICASFLKEKTLKYNVFAVVVCVAATLISLTLPFDKLFGLIYGTFGFIGGLFILMMIYRHLQIKFFPKADQAKQ